jgi:hypothetical protein
MNPPRTIDSVRESELAQGSVENVSLSVRAPDLGV